MADKTKSIKNSTDKELDELLIRLEKENRVQNLVADLRRKSSPMGMFTYDAPQVSTEEPVESLYHYGILGMKWGVRRGKNQVGKTGSAKSKGSADYQKSRQLKKKGAMNLSTQELKDLTQRLQLEKQYKELKPSKYKKGMDIAKNILAAGTTMASLYALSKTPLAQDIKAAITKKVG